MNLLPKIWKNILVKIMLILHLNLNMSVLTIAPFAPIAN